MDTSASSFDCPAEDELQAYVDGSRWLDASGRSAVEQHVSACESCREVIAALARLADGSSTHAGLPATYGRYVVVSVLGAGAMGKVYAAYDPELDRRVAVKVLHPSVSADKTARLVREAKALAKLAHPNIVAVHDVGVALERMWLAMELVQGQTLAAWLAERPRRWPEILDVMIQAGRGLRAVHAAGLLHRDFKPTNVMVESTPEGLRARIMDFGLVRFRSSSEAPTSDARDDPGSRQSIGITRSGALLGTPAYMSPEQFEGRPTDERSDQFAYCVALYEALWRERPFAGATFSAVRTAVIEGAVRPPPSRSGVPNWLRRVCVGGLATDPKRRFSSIDALLAAMERGRASHRRRRVLGVALGLGATAAAVWGYQSWAERERIEACAAEGAALYDTLTPDWLDEIRASVTRSERAYTQTVAEKVEPLLEDYAQQWVAARTDACLARDVAGTFSDTIAAAAVWCFEDRRLALVGLSEQLRDPEVDTAPWAILAAHELPSVAQCLEESYLAGAPTPPQNAAEISALMRTLGELHAMFNVGRVVEGLPRARDVAEQAAALGWDPLTASAELLAAAYARDSGLHDEAQGQLVAAYERAARGRSWEIAATAAADLAYVEGLSREHHEQGRQWLLHASIAAELAGDPQGLHRAYQLVLRSDIEGASGNLDAAILYGSQAIEHYERALGRTHPAVASAVQTLGNAYALRADYAAAAELYRRAVELSESGFGPHHPRVASALNGLALAVAAAGDPRAAQMFYERGLRIVEDAYGPHHEQAADLLVNLAVLHGNAGRWTEAEALTRRAIAIDEALFGPEHPDVAIGLANLAVMQEQRGAHREAIASAARAVLIQETTLGAEHPRLVPTLDNLALSHLAIGDASRARVLLERALAIAERDAADGGSLPVATTLRNLARVDRAQGDLAGAAERFSRSLTLTVAAVGDTHVEVAEGLADLGIVQLAAGDPSSARTSLDRALAIYDAHDGVQLLESRARFTLAQALDALATDRERAVAQAEQARDELRESGTEPELLAEIEQWLRARG